MQKKNKEQIKKKDLRVNFEFIEPKREEKKAVDNSRNIPDIGKVNEIIHNFKMQDCAKSSGYGFIPFYTYAGNILGTITGCAKMEFRRLFNQQLEWDAIYQSEFIGGVSEPKHVMSLTAHKRHNLKELKEYGIIDFVEGKRKKPENPKDYDKLTEEQKKEIEPKIIINYFKILQQEVKSQKQKIADLYGQVEDLTTKLNNLKIDLLKKGGVS